MCGFRGVARLVSPFVYKTEGLKWMEAVPFFFPATIVVYFSPRTDILPGMWFGEAAGREEGEKHFFAVPRNRRLHKQHPEQYQLLISLD